VKEFAPHYVVHLAGAGLEPKQRNDPSTVSVNVQGTFRLLGALEGAPLDGLLLTGSCLEYGTNAGGPLTPHTALHPTELYGATKMAATSIAKIWAKENGVRHAIMRPFTIYGPGEAPYRVEYQMAKALLSRQPLRLSPGMQKRDWVYIADVVEAYRTVLAQGAFNGEVYNVGSGRSISLKELGQALARACGEPPGALQFGADPYRENEIMDLCADCTELEKLGWRAREKLSDGLQALVQDVRRREKLE
jgi:nucleoside-diphosphate-sugar epimerase